jgi:hypothetical protein
MKRLNPKDFMRDVRQERRQSTDPDERLAAEIQIRQQQRQQRHRPKLRTAAA